MVKVVEKISRNPNYNAYRVLYNNKEMKLTILDLSTFSRVYRSFAAHEKALKIGLNLPKIIKTTEDNGILYRFTEWIIGKTLLKEFNSHIDKIYNEYIDVLYNAGFEITDPYFGNFMLSNNRIICIDTKSLKEL